MSKTLSVDQRSTSGLLNRLVEWALEEFDFRISEDGDAFGLVKRGSAVAYPIKGPKRSVQGWLTAEAYKREKVIPNKSVMHDALALLTSLAAQQTPEPLHLRAAWRRNQLYIDLGHADSQILHINECGWAMTTDVPVKFRRSELTSAMPEPVRGLSIHAIFDYLNVREADKPLLLAWMVSAWLPHIATPVLAILGEQGTGKSTVARALTELLDPSPALLRRPPRSEEQWPVMAHGSLILALDNVSALPAWLSDMLCRTVTGEGDVRRKLYADRELVPFAYRRPVILNGIDLGEWRGDLAERTVFVELQPISGAMRRSESQLTSEWQEYLPLILGAFANLVARVLGELPEVPLSSLPRMADYAMVLAAIDSLQKTDGLDKYVAQTQVRTRDFIANDPIAIELKDAIRTDWEGTSAELLDRLSSARGRDDYVRGRLPSSPQGMTGWLRRNAPSLRVQGWRVDSRIDAHRKILVWTLSAPPESAPEEPEAKLASAESEPREQFVDDSWWDDIPDDSDWL